MGAFDIAALQERYGVPSGWVCQASL
jgi:hypothetical protein